MGKSDELGNIGGVNMISVGTQITGDIVTAGDCRIDGSFKGNIISKAKVIIGQNGLVEGDITCQSIEIEGKVHATVKALEYMTLRSSAIFNGNIEVGKIAIEAGATFSGHCQMLNEHPDRASIPKNTK
ncbi:MAG: polymer-forming cytoskeletal protein [Bacteroidales bacterium]|jgi:cytoskeletal protein CcmA (bactofilin family)|nr:polymer-forming cytoskeletal protein [Bacteroidales bacterium]